MKNIYIIRHGETSWNKEGRHQGGEANPPLNDIGKFQAKITGLYLKNYRSKHNIDCIWTSPQIRAKETAEIIKEQLNCKCNIRLCDELRECGSGKLSDLTKEDELHIKFKEVVKNAQPKDAISKNEKFVEIMEDINEKLNLGMESYNSVLQRSLFIIEEIKKSQCNNIIIISHSGLLSTLIPTMYNIPENIISNHNCSISYHTFDGNKFNMISQPDNTHLQLDDLQQIAGDIKIIKSLGKGKTGETFLIEKDNKKYAMKKQIIEDELFDRELDFYKWIENLQNEDKKFFMQLESYNKQKGEIIFELKDGTINNIINNLSKEQILSAFLQSLYAVYLMNNSGYYHFDTKTDNIAYIQTEDKKINLGKFCETKTFGYIFSIIDYGNIMHGKFKLDNFDSQMFKTQHFINSDVSLLVEYTLLNNMQIYSKLNMMHFKMNVAYDIIKQIKRKKYDKIIKFITKKMFVDFAKDYINLQLKDIKDIPKYRALTYEILQIFQIKYPKSFYKIIRKYFNMNFEMREFIISKKYLLFIKKNQNNINKILSKIKKLN